MTSNDDLMTTALTTIKGGHLRLTKQRRQLVDLLVKSRERYVDITELDDQMRQFYPGISHATIYRNLTEFAHLGVVEITRRANGRAVKLRCEQPHHHHFVCQQCGRVFEIQLPEWDPQVFAKQLPAAKITGHSFELYGTCASCRARA